MKTIQFIITTMTLTILFSCSKPENGKDGAPGKEGNANVTQYNFESKTFTSNTIYSIPNFTQEKFDNSVILCYYLSDNSIWYPVPGIGQDAFFITRSYFILDLTNKLNINVRLTKGDLTLYNTAVTFAKFKVMIIPSSMAISAKSATRTNLENMSYKEACNHFNVSE